MKPYELTADEMSQFEKIVLDTVRSLCSEHDFERELVIKKEQQKQKMIRQIRESLKFLNPPNSNGK